MHLIIKIKSWRKANYWITITILVRKQNRSKRSVKLKALLPTPPWMTTSNLAQMMMTANHPRVVTPTLTMALTLMARANDLDAGVRGNVDARLRKSRCCAKRMY